MAIACLKHWQIRWVYYLDIYMLNNVNLWLCSIETYPETLYSSRELFVCHLRLIGKRITTLR